jgi:hypothetical protein
LPDLTAEDLDHKMEATINNLKNLLKWQKKISKELLAKL